MSLDATARFVPKYFAIEQSLRARVRVMKPGDLMPSDAELCDEFGVSRMTARQAVAALVEDGLLHRSPGRGTFVAQPSVHRGMGDLLSFSEEMRRRGFVPSSIVLDAMPVPLSQEERAQLRSRVGRGVLVRRVRLADDEPVALERVLLPWSCRFVLDADLSRESLHELLTQGGFPPARASGTLMAQLASAEDARLLALRRPAGLLVESRTVTDGAGTAVELTETRYSGHRYVFDVTLTRGEKAR